MENVRKHRDIDVELFNIRTRISYYRVFHRKSISNRNKTKNKNTTDNCE